MNYITFLKMSYNLGINNKIILDKINESTINDKILFVLKNKYYLHPKNNNF